MDRQFNGNRMGQGIGVAEFSRVRPRLSLIKNLAAMCLIVVAVMFPSGPSTAADVDKELASRASVKPFMVNRSADDSVVYATGEISRSPGFGTSSQFCVGAHGQYFQDNVVPRRMVYFHEESCRFVPQRLDVDPKAFTAQLAGSVPTVVFKSTYQWSKRQQDWVYLGETRATGTASFDLRFTGTSAAGTPVVRGAPVCVTYSLLTPVWPCPTTHVGAGSTRSAKWVGSIHLRGVGRTFSSGDAGITNVFETTLAIWWGT